MTKVNDELILRGAESPKERSAHFVCSLCLASPNGNIVTFDGTVEGTMVWPPRGNNGFGYDPVFEPHGETITFGEMEPERKHAMSHRNSAFEKLVAHLDEPAT